MTDAWWQRVDGPLLGRYRIERELGEGGMARVFLATDLKSGRIVAIKSPKIESFPPDRLDELLRRFTREFQAQIRDPIQGVVPVYDADDVTDADGVRRPILVMQYLSGGSLGTRLGSRVGARERTQTLGEVLAWLVPIAGAIDALHRRKFLHRDVKPDNILFDGDDKPFLADFGVVGLLDSEHGLESTIGGSATALSPGSPGYMAPESIHVDAVARSTPSSDQFSLGITVYEALCGRLPMSVGSAAAWYGAIAHWSPAPLDAHWHGGSPEAAATVMKAISLHARDRFLSCTEFARALEAAVRKLEAPAPAPGRSHWEAAPGVAVPPAPALKPPGAAPQPPSHRRRALAWTLGAIAVGTALLLGARYAWPPADTARVETTQLEPPAPQTATTAATSTSTAAIGDTAIAKAATPDRDAAVQEDSTALFQEFLDAAKEPAAPPVAPPQACNHADKDKDGVDDCEDYCKNEDPGYRPGSQVSPFGCKDSDWNVSWYDDPQKTTLAADDMNGVMEKIRKSHGERIGVYGSDTAGGRRRVRMVLDYLTSRGVDAARLESKFVQSADRANGATPTCGDDCVFDQVVSIAVEGAPGMYRNFRR